MSICITSISAYCYENIASWRNQVFDEEGNRGNPDLAPYDENLSFSLARRILTEIVLPVVAIGALGEAIARVILIIPLFLAGIVTEYVSGGNEFLLAGAALAVFGPVTCFATTLVSISGLWNNLYNAEIFSEKEDIIQELINFIGCD